MPAHRSTHDENTKCPHQLTVLERGPHRSITAPLQLSRSPLPPSLPASATLQSAPGLFCSFCFYCVQRRRRRGSTLHKNASPVLERLRLEKLKERKAKKAGFGIFFPPSKRRKTLHFDTGRSPSPSEKTHKPRRPQRIEFLSLWYLYDTCTCLPSQPSPYCCSSSSMGEAFKYDATVDKN